MARVRFYEQGTDRYVTLRVEERGIYLEVTPITIRSRRTDVPIKKPQSISGRVPIQHTLADWDAEKLLFALISVFEDFESTFFSDPKAMFSIKPGYKNRGYQLSVSLGGEWTNFSGENVLLAFLSYREAITAD